MNTPKQRTIPVSENGRMNLPADMRRALGLAGSGHLIVSLIDNEIRITTASQALKRVRELASPFKPSGAYASDQLIEDRREESVRENDEQDASARG
ncbi:AbrB/MazE/SpoVT family DNA-binding domain-containing protein [Salinisphaera sp. C84B14]|uniref:AbrB/MazE/SpoVT family DNA-binding domain-containing protein n=1 Tax=Salinisphaera sp. C84B14 TaxID=1304155 RepID=UPI003341E340